MLNQHQRRYGAAEHKAGLLKRHEVRPGSRHEP